MRYSQYYIPTLKEVPKEAEVMSHKLMLRSGMIRKLSSGVFTYLPTGLRSLNKVSQIVREEMNRAGACELLMPMVQPRSLWDETGRWEQMKGVLLQFQDRKGSDFCLGPTHEEVITDLVRGELRSYKDLPKTLYQIQTKYRDEIRPRFGLMRGREFLMKDAYSFDRTKEDTFKSYEVMREAYKKIFSRCGLQFRPVLADSGDIGGSLSHEFQVLAHTGEDRLLSCTKCDYCCNVEVHNGKNQCPQCRGELEELRGIEVGHIFYLGTKYSEKMKAFFIDEDNKEKPFEMGCYGIGIGRTIAAAIEQNHDEKGIKFPKALAPFEVVLINLDPEDVKTSEKAEELYQYLVKHKIDVLYDERKERPGIKFNDADLMGIPLHIVLGKRGLQNQKISIKNRFTGGSSEVELSHIEKKILESLK
ncbi:MAG: proline--tRNA ligase [Deltaproteobacteria bacterium]|nr:proline--tRNA ligase [Deltaproteobacteria bacterium]